MEIAVNQGVIHYQEEGDGFPVVLLHGFLETLQIWNDFAKDLSKDFRVICLDLPGQGKSLFSKDVFTMSFLADTVNEVLDKLNIKKCFVAGHSMGGFVTLSLAEQYPEKLAGFTLLNANPFTDSEKRKRDRIRLMDILQRDNKLTLVSSFFQNAFAEENIAAHKKTIEKAILQARSFDVKNVIAAIRGMLSREDKSNILRDTNLPGLFFFGAKDKILQPELIQNLQLSATVKPVMLEHAGHMAFIEQKMEVLKEIVDFFRSNISHLSDWVSSGLKTEEFPEETDQQPPQ